MSITFPRTVLVVGFVVVSAVAQFQTVVDLHPSPPAQVVEAPPRAGASPRAGQR